MNSRVASVLIILSTACFYGCASSPDSRIKGHETALSSLSQEDQMMLREGQVNVGYTQELVQIALGDPDRRYTRTTASGTSEVWAYRDHAPRFSLGVGIGGGSRSSGVGGGIGLTTGGGDQRDDKIRVVFEQGRVSAVERRGPR